MNITPTTPKTYFNIPTEKELYPAGLPVVKTLDNRIRIVVEEMPGRILVSVRFLIDAGSVDDIIPGTAHVSEHMVFNGTKNRTEKQIQKESNRVAADINASTSELITVFESDVLPENVHVPIELFLDMLFNPTLSHFNREKEIILNEFRKNENGHEEDCPHCHFQKLIQGLWNDHPIYRPVGGTEESIEQIKLENIKDFLRKHYTPDNLVISVAGNCKSNKIIRKIEGLTKFINGTRNKIPVPPLQYSPGIHVEQANKATLTTLGYITEGPPENQRQEMYASTILSHGLSPRLWNKLRKNSGLAAYNSGANYNAGTLGGVFNIGTEVDDEKSLKAATIILSEIEKVKDLGLTDDEFYDLGQSFRKHTLGHFDNTVSRAINNGLVLLSNGRLITINEICEPITHISNEYLIEMANKLFQKERLSLIVVGGKNLPNQNEFELILM